MNYLILTEGEKTEKNILREVLKRYDFNVVDSPKVNSYSDIEIDIETISNDKENIVIAQAPKNRLSELLKLYNEKNYDLDKVFGNRANYFAGIFLVFDVDHTSIEDLKNMFDIHNDETEKGLLLVSSPCIEIMADYGRTSEIRVNHLSDYKKEINKHINDELRFGKNVEQYIIDNFEELAIKYLDQNVEEFNSYNVMEHPQLVIDKINETNIRSNEEVIYRYFTTVVYVAMAYICRLVKIDNNYNIIREYLLNRNEN